MCPQNVCVDRTRTHAHALQLTHCMQSMMLGKFNSCLRVTRACSLLLWRRSSMANRAGDAAAAPLRLCSSETYFMSSPPAFNCQMAATFAPIVLDRYVCGDYEEKLPRVSQYWLLLWPSKH